MPLAKLTHESPMPFGKYGPHQGNTTKMKDLPADYLFWYIIW